MFFLAPAAPLFFVATRHGDDGPPPAFVATRHGDEGPPPAFGSSCSCFGTLLASGKQQVGNNIMGAKLLHDLPAQVDRRTLAAGA